MPTDIPKQYEPKDVEARWYPVWEARGYFNADPNPRKRPHAIMIPLPNVTGALHMGHALNGTLQDLLTRWRRMQGYEALWMPGTDHAGIATQAVVERRMFEEEGLTRHDIGREALVNRIWRWKDVYEKRILGQLQKLGASADWRRTRFTLDEVCSRAVRRTFFKMFRDGLIYRGKRLVNWDTFLQTAVADDEVFHEEVDGHFWTFTYPVVGSEESIAFSTTRPETMLGDTAVCVHPSDERYQHLIGRNVRIPLNGREIPIIADALLAKPGMGTGAVKVTPAHDPNDYACGLRHKLPMINLLNPDGTLNENAGKYAGLDRLVAREKVVDEMQQLGHFVQVESRKIDLAHSDRSKTPIEPMLSEQWFVEMNKPAKSLSNAAINAVKDGRVTFYPRRYENTYLDWIGEKRDWCISRQLWWGHQIPVWSKPAPKNSLQAILLAEFAQAGSANSKVLAGVNFHAKMTFQRGDDGVLKATEDTIETVQQPGSTVEQVYGEGIAFQIYSDPQNEQVMLLACISDERPELESQFEAKGFKRDPDVLDTWFSSALWPHETLGWPNGPPPLAGEAGPISSPPYEGGAGGGRAGVRAASEATPPQSPPSQGGEEESDLSQAGEEKSGCTNAVLDYFYPTSVLVTSRDIITLWVARMVLTGLYNMGDVPFRQVCIHPKILDGFGQTMSKSKGNGVDPMDLIDKYGTDAVRFTIASFAGETQDVRLPVGYECPNCGTVIPQELQHQKAIPAGGAKPRVKCPKCKESFQYSSPWFDPDPGEPVARIVSERFDYGRNFCNKLWNAARFALLNLEGYTPDGVEDLDLYLEDRWILSRLATVATEVTEQLGQYHFDAATRSLREFVWSEFCDWYLEMIKPRLRDESLRPAAQRVLVSVLDTILRLLQPFMPFITEELWQRLREIAPQRGLPLPKPAAESVMIAPWPDDLGGWQDTRLESRFNRLQEIIVGVRNVRAQYSIGPAVPLQLSVRTSDEVAGDLHQVAGQFENLAKVALAAAGPAVERPRGSASFALTDADGFIPLEGVIDRDAELARQRKEAEKIRGFIAGQEKKLANPSFVERAPAEVVNDVRETLAGLHKQLASVEEIIRQLGGD